MVQNDGLHRVKNLPKLVQLGQGRRGITGLIYQDGSETLRNVREIEMYTKGSGSGKRGKSEREIRAEATIIYHE